MGRHRGKSGRIDAGVRRPPGGTGRASRRHGDGQGLGALQARRGSLDRPPACPAVSGLHPRPELPRLGPGRSRHRVAREGLATRSRRVRTAAGARQSLPREGPGRSRDPGAPDAAAAPEAQSDRSRVGTALPRARLPEGRIRRSSRGDVHRRPEARPVERGRPDQSRETAGRPASVAGGVRHAAAALANRWPARPAKVPVDSGIPRKRDRAPGHEAA